MLIRLRSWMRAIFRADSVEREMTDEMRSHLERATERLIERGMSRAQAVVEARREFGNVAYIQEQGRDARGVRWIDETIQDVRFGIRSLGKTPAFSAVAVASLVLGIAVTTTVWTMTTALARRLTISDPRSFVTISQTWSKPAYDLLQTRVPALSDVIARADERILLAPRSANDAARSVSGELVSGNYFAALHAPMTIGRRIGVVDLREGSAPIAVLNYRFWKGQLNGDSAVVGRVVHLANGTAVTIVGVAGRDFSGVRGGGPDLWLPLTIRPAVPSSSQAPPPDGNWFGAPNYSWLTLYGRLVPGHSPDEAREQIGAAMRETLSDSAIAARGPVRVRTAEASDGQGFVRSMFLAGALVVLLVACANVASLTVARAIERRREIAMRMSLGASRLRLVRQLTTESAILVAMSATIAFALTTWSLRALALSGGLEFITDDDPERLARALAPNASAFGLSLALSALCVVVCGLVPALRASRTTLAAAMKLGGADPRSRTRIALRVAQVALSIVLVLTASVLARSTQRALSLDLGFDRERVISVSSPLRMTGYDSTRIRVLSQTIEQRLSALPGVRSLARGDVPLVGGRFKAILKVDTRAGVTQHDGYVAAVTPGYFSTFGIPLVRGRSFTEAELRSRAQVVVVSEATARSLWPNADPIGQVIDVDPLKKGRIAPETIMPSAVVIGIARDAQMVNLGEIPPIYVYLPSASGDLLLAASGDPAALVTAIRGAVMAIDQNIVVVSTPVSELIATNGSVYNVRFATGFATTIGVLATILAAVGIFGLMAYSVARRSRELGIRIALGARGATIVALVVREGLQVVVIGCAIGLVLGLAGSRLFRAMLFGMSALDPIAFVVTGTVVVTIAAGACYLPVRRATRIDPMVSLKAD